MKAVAGVVGALSISGVCVLAACVSSSQSPNGGTDGGAVPHGDDGGSVDASSVGTNDAATPGDSSSPDDAPTSSCVWPDAGCTYIGAGASTGTGACGGAEIILNAGFRELVFIVPPQGCGPLFEFSTIFNAATVTPGTYTLATVEGSSGVWLGNGGTWWMRKQPSVQGSLTLILTEVGTVPEDDAGTLSAHGSLTAYLDGDQSGNIEDAGVTVTATF
jgi:hypothetical protein